MAKKDNKKLRKNPKIKLVGNRSRYFLRPSKKITPLLTTVQQSINVSKYSARWKRSSKARKTTFNDLPAEIFIKILSYLSVKDLCKIVAPVCRKWYIYSRSPSLWCSLRFEDNLIHTQEVCRLLHLAPKLKRLEIIDRYDNDILLMEVCRSNRQLQHLTINHTFNPIASRLSPYAINFSTAPAHFNWQMIESIFEDNTFPYFSYCSSNFSHIPSNILVRLIRSCRRIASINLVGIEMRSQCFFKELASLPRLQSVDLTVRNRGGTLAWDMITLLCTHLGEDACAKPLHLQGIYKWCRREAKTCITTQIRTQVVYMSQILRQIAPTLAVLNLDVLCLEEESYEELLKCVSLQALHLNNAINITSATVARIITGLQHLISLRINQAYRMRASALNTLFHHEMRSKYGISKNLLLKYLSLVECPAIDDATIHSITQYCPDLEQLSLYMCQKITDEGLRSIIQFCPKLRYLNLWHCQGIVGRILMKIPLLVPNLKLLLVGEYGRYGFQDKKKEENVCVLKKIMPYLVIHYSQSPPKGWIKFCNNTNVYEMV